MYSKQSNINELNTIIENMRFIMESDFLQDSSREAARHCFLFSVKILHDMDLLVSMFGAKHVESLIRSARSLSESIPFVYELQ
jgi:hypothetical protein